MDISFGGGKGFKRRANEFLVALKKASGKIFENACGTTETNGIDPGKTSMLQCLWKSNISIGNRRK